MDSSASREPDRPPVSFPRDRAGGIIATATVLVAVLGLALSIAAAAAVVGFQVARMTASLPQYEETIRHKVATLNEMTVGRLQSLNGQAGRIIEQNAVPRPPAATAGIVLGATTLALNDAGDRLSRFFVSQFLVNLGVGCAVGIGLSIVGLPHALLWGALAGVLRFVPYVGVWIAALFSTVLAAAVDPGWSLAIATLGLFAMVELIAGQLVEPQLYGHTTGLSPLSVVIAAIFWSWLWGPIGLIVSTPLTLCLVVAGRHIKALSLLDILLGDNQALTMPQRFYQRALSVPPGSVMLCVGLSAPADDLATELLVRILRGEKIDARHLSIDDLNSPPPPDASPASVSVVYLVSAFPSEERERGRSVAETVRLRFPGVRLVTVFLPGLLLQPASPADTLRRADKAATSFGHAVQICLDMQKDNAVTGAARSTT